MDTCRLTCVTVCLVVRHPRRGQQFSTSFGLIPLVRKCPCAIHDRLKSSLEGIYSMWWLRLFGYRLNVYRTDVDFDGHVLVTAILLDHWSATCDDSQHPVEETRERHFSVGDVSVGYGRERSPRTMTVRLNAT